MSSVAERMRRLASVVNQTDGFEGFGARTEPVADNPTLDPESPLRLTIVSYNSTHFAEEVALIIREDGQAGRIKIRGLQGREDPSGRSVPLDVTTFTLMNESYGAVQEYAAALCEHLHRGALAMLAPEDNDEGE